jgi:hypothetical protein
MDIFLAISLSPINALIISINLPLGIWPSVSHTRVSKLNLNRATTILALNAPRTAVQPRHSPKLNPVFALPCSRTLFLKPSSDNQHHPESPPLTLSTSSTSASSHSPPSQPLDSTSDPATRIALEYDKFLEYLPRDSVSPLRCSALPTPRPFVTSAAVHHSLS